jgi:exosortase E/protease (VPEID-CTERM system)
MNQPNGASTEVESFRSILGVRLPAHLLGRLYFLFILVAIEYLFCFGGRGTIPGQSIPGHLTFYGENTDTYGQIPIFAFLVFLGFGHFRLKVLQENISFGRILFACHLLCMAVVLAFTVAARMGLTWQLFDTYSYTKSAFYVVGTALLALACVPLESWRAAIRATGRLWLYASLAGVAGWWFGSQVRLLWGATMTAQSGIMQRATLRAVGAVLGHFLPDLVVDPATFTIGTSRYAVVIAGGCSGVEGLGLVLIFISLWLWVYRKETRFPQAFLLIPCALGCSWLLNILRLCALILIGNAGGSIAFQTGFHIQAGWIAFTVVALAFSLATQKISWMRKMPALASGNTGNLPGGGMGNIPGSSMHLLVQSGESPATRAYLLPFLAILIAATVSKLVSGYFDWLYPLRFIASAIVLWYFWPELKKINWRFGWFGPAAGVAVFLLWIAPAWFASLGWAHQPAASRLGADLASLSPLARWTWIAFRVAAAVITVPIAEELAFRGYLARRLINREFDQVSFTRLTAFSIVLSSVVFGMEHMKNLMDWQHLALGTLAGLAFAAALRWRGRMGDAVVAHAVSNLLLAAWVLGFGDWAQW